MLLTKLAGLSLGTPAQKGWKKKMETEKEKKKEEGKNKEKER
jgi:hypothetical protein